MAAEEAPAVHIPSPHELEGKVEPRAEDFLEREDVLPGGDASEHHYLAVRPSALARRYA